MMALPNFAHGLVRLTLSYSFSIFQSSTVIPPCFVSDLFLYSHSFCFLSVMPSAQIPFSYVILSFIPGAY